MRHVHGFGWQAQLLCGDQRQRSVRAGKIDTAYHYGKRAILLQPAEGGGWLRSTWPTPDCHAYPDLPAFQCLWHFLPGLLALHPQWMLLDLLETFQQADTGPAAQPEIRVAFFEGIELAELKRVHLKLLAEFLHGRFHCEVCLRTGRGAIGSGTGLVSLHHVAADIQVGTAIGAGE